MYNEMVAIECIKNNSSMRISKFRNLLAVKTRNGIEGIAKKSTWN